MGIGPRHHDLAGLQRRTQGIQGLGAVFRQFIEEQHPVMGQRGLARSCLQPAPGQGRHTGRMVRTAERPVAGQGPALDQPGHRPDHRGLQQFGRGQGRQQARQTLSQHRLARARRTDKQQIMAAGRRDLQRAFGALLTLDLAQVGPGPAGAHRPRFGRTQHLGPLEMVDQADQRTRGEDGDLPGPGRLGPVGLGTDQAQPHGRGRHRRRQGPADRGDLAVQPQFADRGPAVQRVGRDHPERRHQHQADGQVEMTTLLGQVGRGQVGDDPFRRQAQADTGKGPAHPFAALGHRLVRQADDGETGLGCPDQLHLNVDPARLDPVEGHRHHASDHDALPLYGKEQITNRK